MKLSSVYSEGMVLVLRMDERYHQASISNLNWAMIQEHDQVNSQLSEREIEIIELVATGLTNQEIAERLTISKRTVDNHVSNIFNKTGAKNRVALLNWAMDHGKICRDGFNCCTLNPNHPNDPGNRL